MLITPSLNVNGVLTLRRGDTLSMRLTAKQSAQQPMDLTGYTVLLQAKYKENSIDTRFQACSDLVYVADFPNCGTITLGGAAGTLDILVPANIMNNVDTKEGIWALRFTEPGGTSRTLLYGKLVVLEKLVN